MNEEPAHRKGCDGKHRYPDKRAAVGAMKCVARSNPGEVRAKGLHAYPCDFCRGWHMGKGGHATHPAIERRETKRVRNDVDRRARHRRRELLDAAERGE